jgi:SnoaL-like domain
MDERLQEMLDHYEIKKTLGEYCQGCDRCDEPRMAGVYGQDSWDDHGAHKAPGPQFAREMIQQILERTQTLYHMLGQSLIQIQGDEAGAETYFLAASRSVDEDGSPMVNQLGGRFVDRLRRENGHWRISHRTVVRDWSISLPAAAPDWTSAAQLTEGQRSNADPCFAALGIQHLGRSAG